jgi:transposase
MGRKPSQSVEFRDEAVRLARLPGNTYQSVGRDLGVSRESIRRWTLAFDAREGPGPRLVSEEHAELVALRRRVRVLEEEREILVKAAAFFARENGRTP